MTSIPSGFSSDREWAHSKFLNRLRFLRASERGTKVLTSLRFKPFDAYAECFRAENVNNPAFSVAPNGRSLSGHFIVPPTPTPLEYPIYSATSLRLVDIEESLEPRPSLYGWHGDRQDINYQHETIHLIAEEGRVKEHVSEDFAENYPEVFRLRSELLAFAKKNQLVAPWVFDAALQTMRAWLIAGAELYPPPWHFNEEKVMLAWQYAHPLYIHRDVERFGQLMYPIVPRLHSEPYQDFEKRRRDMEKHWEIAVGLEVGQQKGKKKQKESDWHFEALARAAINRESQKELAEDYCVSQSAINQFISSTSELIGLPPPKIKDRS